MLSGFNCALCMLLSVKGERANVSLTVGVALPYVQGTAEVAYVLADSITFFRRNSRVRSAFGVLSQWIQRDSAH